MRINGRIRRLQSDRGFAIVVVNGEHYFAHVLNFVDYEGRGRGSNTFNGLQPGDFISFEPVEGTQERGLQATEVAA